MTALRALLAALRRDVAWLSCLGFVACSSAPEPACVAYHSPCVASDGTTEPVRRTCAVSSPAPGGCAAARAQSPAAASGFGGPDEPTVDYCCAQ